MAIQLRRAIALVEEGKNSRADLFFGQDAGALGALAQEKRTLTIPAQLLEQIDPRFRSSTGQWIGISGRARVIDYNTKLVKPSELPSSVSQLTDPKWRGKVGWAPSNGSFQSFVTAMRLLEGDQKTLEWLKAMKANGAKDYGKNAAIVEALGKGEIALGLVNNYYLYRFTYPYMLLIEPHPAIELRGFWLGIGHSFSLGSVCTEQLSGYTFLASKGTALRG